MAWAVWAACTATVVIAAVARLVLGVHWLTDVAVGAVLGTARAACASWLTTPTGPVPDRRRVPVVARSSPGRRWRCSSCSHPWAGRSAKPSRSPAAPAGSPARSTGRTTGAPRSSTGSRTSGTPARPRPPRPHPPRSGIRSGRGTHASPSAVPRRPGTLAPLHLVPHEAAWDAGPVTRDGRPGPLHHGMAARHRPHGRVRGGDLVRPPADAPRGSRGHPPAGWLALALGAQIPPALRARTVAVSNGGFRFADSLGGFYENGRVGRPLRAGGASLVVHADGRADVIAWPAHRHLDPSIVAVRQNLHLVVDQELTLSPGSPGTDTTGGATPGSSSSTRGAPVWASTGGAT